MHRKTFLGLVFAATGLDMGAPSFAQPHDRGHDREDHREGPQRHADRGHGQWEREAHGPVFGGARGPEWHRGGRIPPAYRDHAYVVNNWRVHRLSPPPRGYEWVQVGSDYVLVAVRTGVIVQIILG